MILVVRECVTSHTSSALVENERHETLRDNLIRLCIELIPLDGPNAVIRVDPAPSFQALVDDALLKKYRISIEIGRIKNKNKNPVAEKANRELETELLKMNPMGGHVSSRELAVATACLNSRIRSRCLSAREMLTQRDQFLCSQIPLKDQDLILQQHELRKANHPHSEKSKAPLKDRAKSHSLQVGDLVYLYSDRNKSCARDRYLVVSIEGAWCNIQKFIGSQLRNTSYRVKMSECYKVRSQISQSTIPSRNRIEDDSDTEIEVQEQPVLPQIPSQIAQPPEAINENCLTSQPYFQEIGDTTISDEIVDTTTNAQGSCHVIEEQQSNSQPRRSSRIRGPPLRYGNPVYL